MESLLRSYDQAERRIVRWSAANGILLLRVSLGIVFLWFGALKFLPAFSPAEELAGVTIAKLTFGLMEPKAAVAFLAVWETAIGVALGFGLPGRIPPRLPFLRIAGTATPPLPFS